MIFNTWHLLGVGLLCVWKAAGRGAEPLTKKYLKKIIDFQPITINHQLTTARRARFACFVVSHSGSAFLQPQNSEPKTLNSEPKTQNDPKGISSKRFPKTKKELDSFRNQALEKPGSVLLSHQRTWQYPRR